MAQNLGEVQEYAGEFLQLGVDSADALIDENWDDVDRSERSIIVAALKEGARRDRRFGELLARWRAENRSVSERDEPYVEQELQRKGRKRPTNHVFHQEKGSATLEADGGSRWQHTARGTPIGVG